MKYLSLFVSCFFFFSLPAYGEDSPLTIEGAQTINPVEAEKLFKEGAIFIDVRMASDFEAGRIPEAVHIDPYADLNEEKLMQYVAKDAPVVFYCNGRNCLRSTDASKKAIKLGWSKVYFFRDGFPGWEQAGYPVE